MHDSLLMYQQPASLTQPFESHIHSPQLSTTSLNTRNAGYVSSFQEMCGFPAWQLHVATCDCFHRQTLNLASLHAPKPSVGNTQHSAFADSLQCITGTILACQQSVTCRSCEKNSSMMCLLLASLQMVFNHLEALHFREQLDSSSTKTRSSYTSHSSVSRSIIRQDPQSEQQKIIRMMQIRHMLIKTENTLKSIREIIPLAQQRFSIDSAISGFGEGAPGSSREPDYLYESVDKLQAEIGSLLSTIVTQQA